MILRALSFAAPLSLAAANSAFAQWGYEVPMAPPMDMSALISRQMQLHAWGDQAAIATAQKYDDDVQAFRRATGYIGPMPSPVSTAQLQQSAQAQQKQYDRNNAAWRDTSDRTIGAIDRYAVEVIRGQGAFFNPATG